MNRHLVNKVGDIIRHSKLGSDTWIVVKTAVIGGGYGHGPHDYYPPGHQITCYPIKGDFIDNDAQSKSFYQTGSFISEAMIPFVEPDRKVIVGHSYHIVTPKQYNLCD